MKPEDVTWPYAVMWIGISFGTSIGLWAFCWMVVNHTRAVFKRAK